MRYAVSFVNLSDNDLLTKIVQADSWQSAIVAFDPGLEWLAQEPDLGAAKFLAFDGDCLINAVEID